MRYITVESVKREEMLDITAQLQDLAQDASIKKGAALIFCLHTTAAVTVNENADPDVKRDILAFLSKRVPKNEAYFQHAEGNSDSHLKTLATGSSLVVPIENGRLVLGTWQSVYLCEYDGPRARQAAVQFLASL